MVQVSSFSTSQKLVSIENLLKIYLDLDSFYIIEQVNSTHQLCNESKQAVLLFRKMSVHLYLRVGQDFWLRMVSSEDWFLSDTKCDSKLLPTMQNIVD